MRADGRSVDWDVLRAEAVRLMRRAYAPYSDFPVGAAGLVEDGRVVAGCNVENASYGLTMCAECAMVCALVTSGGGRLVAVAVVDGSGAALVPCGRCRQLIFEHGGADCLVDLPVTGAGGVTAGPDTTAGGGPRPISALLPVAFGPGHLAAPATRRQPANLEKEAP